MGLDGAFTIAFGMRQPVRQRTGSGHGKPLGHRNAAHPLYRHEKSRNRCKNNAGKLGGLSADIEGGRRRLHAENRGRRAERCLPL